LDVGQRCYFLGFVDNPWEIILESDVFIFPSRSEGFGIALVEAASLGIPIICSDIPTFREMFDDNEVTFFKLDDIDDLNNKILMLDEIKDKVSLAKLKAEKLFSLESMCYNYYQEYKKLIDAN
jgi:glycosyltransferase involved in cell wall biosynthesis